MSLYTGGRRNSTENSSRCGYTKVCLVVAGALMVLLATAVSLAVYFIMQPDDGTTKSEVGLLI